VFFNFIFVFLNYFFLTLRRYSALNDEDGDTTFAIERTYLAAQEVYTSTSHLSISLFHFKQV